MQALGVNGNAEMFGNAAGHHVNANFIQQAREALTANYANAEQAARGLLNGWVTGRENRLPGFPGAMDEIPQRREQVGGAIRQRNGAAERAQDRERESDTARDPADTRPERRGTNRRRNAIVDMLAGSGMAGRSQTAEEREQERRIQDWANGVDAS